MSSGKNYRAAGSGGSPRHARACTVQVHPCTGAGQRPTATLHDVMPRQSRVLPLQTRVMPLQTRAMPRRSRWIRCRHAFARGSARVPRPSPRSAERVASCSTAVRRAPSPATRLGTCPPPSPPGESAPPDAEPQHHPRSQGDPAPPAAPNSAAALAGVAKRRKPGIPAPTGAPSQSRRKAGDPRSGVESTNAPVRDTAELIRCRTPARTAPRSRPSPRRAPGREAPRGLRTRRPGAPGRRR